MKHLEKEFQIFSMKISRKDFKCLQFSQELWRRLDHLDSVTGYLSLFIWLSGKDIVFRVKSLEFLIYLFNLVKLR